jgi:hypothetical protein
MRTLPWRSAWRRVVIDHAPCFMNLRPGRGLHPLLDEGHYRYLASWPGTRMVPVVKIARMTITGQWPPTRRPEWPHFGPVRASAGTSVHAQRG